MVCRVQVLQSFGFIRLWVAGIGGALGVYGEMIRALLLAWYGEDLTFYACKILRDIPVRYHA